MRHPVHFIQLMLRLTATHRSHASRPVAADHSLSTESLADVLNLSKNVEQFQLRFAPNGKS